jgi:hypothetical protein
MYVLCLQHLYGSLLRPKMTCFPFKTLNFYTLLSASKVIASNLEACENYTNAGRHSYTADYSSRDGHHIACSII